MIRLIFVFMRSITAIVLCGILFTGCSSLLIHNDDNIAVVATKVTVRAVNCALTIFSFCMSEWWFMHDAYNASLVWVGNGDIHGDNYKCQQEASSISSGASGYIHMPVGNNVMSVPMDSGGGRQINQQLYHSCMRARGYTLVDGYEYDKWREKQANASARAPQPKVDSTAALTNLGLQYYNGQGVPQDYAQARQWWEKAAIQGNADAQYNLGFLYDNGQGVSQDYAQARQWYEKAAIQGNANAQANIGRMYANGQGGPQDYALARQWYAKAIAQGNASAQFYLGWMHTYGQGGPQDFVQGYLWLSMAALQGNNHAAQERDKLVTKMTPAQLSEAQRLAQQCQALQFKGC